MLRSTAEISRKIFFALFLASAGMLRLECIRVGHLLSIPRERGDAPAQRAIAMADPVLFPASAGMLLFLRTLLLIRLTIPRERGDAPDHTTILQLCSDISPPCAGCLRHLFPACGDAPPIDNFLLRYSRVPAGMFRPSLFYRLSKKELFPAFAGCSTRSALVAERYKQQQIQL